MNQPEEDSLSVVIPVFNSAEILPVLIDRLLPVLRSNSASYEVILVNDGSLDGSWDAICKLGREHESVHGINLMRNYGQHNALVCGFGEARCGIIVTIDDDLQHPPEEIPKLLSKLAEGYDVVYGTPEEQQHGFLRNVASHITKLALQNAMGADIARNVSAFRAFRYQVFGAFANHRGSFVSVDVLLTWATTRFGAMPVCHNPRYAGKSNYTIGKLVVHAFNMMTGFTTLPLQMASIIGFGFTLFGLAVFIYVIGRYLVQGAIVPGFPFLASMIAVFSGAQLFALGIIGEYLGRMHFRTMDRPIYVVRSTTRGNCMK